MRKVTGSIALAGIAALLVLIQTGPALAADESVLRDACMAGDGNPQACTDYAGWLIDSRDPAKAKIGGRLLGITCDAGFAPACYKGGMGARNKAPGAGFADYEEAYYFRSACDLGHARGCLLLGVLYTLDSGSLLIKGEGPAIALMQKACELGDADACGVTARVLPKGRADPLWARVPPIDPSLPSAEQMRIARQWLEQGGDRRIEGMNAVLRLQAEAVPDADYELGLWYRDGKHPEFAKDPKLAATMFYNAGSRGHVEAMVELGMAYWYGDGREVDQELGLKYMRMAAVRGNEKAQAIYRSMLAEPVRQENARQARLAEERAKQARWAQSYDWGARPSYGSWSPSSRYDHSGAAASQARYEAQRDQRDWSNAVGYITGSQSSCAYSNPYC